MFCYLGNMETSSFEDTCREMFGVHAYIVFTVDKLVQNIVRQVSKVLFRARVGVFNHECL